MTADRRSSGLWDHGCSHSPLMDVREEDGVEFEDLHAVRCGGADFFCIGPTDCPGEISGHE